MMLIVPLTLGSMRKFRLVISATAFTTASMSALTKLSVTESSAAAGGAGAPAPIPAQSANRSARRTNRPRKAGRATAKRCTGLQRFVVNRRQDDRRDRARACRAGKLYESEQGIEFRSDRALSGIIA